MNEILKKALMAKKPSLDLILEEFNKDYYGINAELEDGKTLLH